MAYLVSTSFDNFIKKISIDTDARRVADARKSAISDLLKDSLTILDIFETGSLVRGTGLKAISDADVVVVLHYGRHLEHKTPLQALNVVRDALSNYNAQIVKKNGQAVTLYFKSWPNVDIVPAKRVDAGLSYELQIPDSNTGVWISTNPRLHDGAMANVSNRRLQLVRMIKCWNRAHSSYFESFHIEQVVLKMPSVTELVWTESSWPWLIFQFFDTAIELTGPSEPMSVPYELEDWKELRSRLGRARDLARDGWYAIQHKSDPREAIDRFSVLFGSDFPAYG